MITLNQHKENITKRIIAAFTDDTPVKTGLAAFFPAETSIEKQIGIEVERNRQLIAVDVQRGTDANRNKFSLSSEKLYEPPMYNESWDFTEAQRYDVTFGERTNPSASQALNMINQASRKIELMRRKIERAIEIQRSQVLQTGIVTLKNGDNIDFKRKAASIGALTGADAWDATTGTPLEDIADGCTFLREEGLAAGNSVSCILGQEAFAALKNNPQFVQEANFRRVSRVELGMPQFDNVSGLVFQGQIGTADYIVNLWTYNEFYETNAGVKTKYIDAKNMILISDDFVGKTAYAGIPAITRDAANAEYSEYITPIEADFYLNNWIDYSKKAHWFELASAPLAMAVSIDRLYTKKVVE